MVKNKRFLRVISMLLAFVLVFHTVLPASAAGVSENPDSYAIYPIPQKITYAGGGFAVSDEAAIVADEEVDKYTIAFLEKVLDDYDVTYKKETEAQKGKLNIVLQVRNAEMLKDKALFEKADAYMLDAKDGTIVISGRDTDSVYYGVATLQMMFSSFGGEKLLNAHIEDYASVAKRGYIEGFYGAWSFEERADLMRFAGNYKMNSYVYAAKGDEYHTSKWAELYPAETLAKLEELVRVGEETKVKFAWSVHLGNFFKTLNDANYEALYAQLTAKIDQLYSIGVRKFDVLNDDFGGGSHDTVVKVLNRLNKDLKAKGCEPLVYCPQGYNVAWSGGGEELAALRNLDADINIYWTGADVNSPITQESIDYLTEKTGHKPDFWLNYPVNEHGKSGIYLGDITHYARDNVSGMAGFHSNPSRFAYANEIGLYQLAALVWNNSNYSEKANEIWLSAFDYLQPEVEDAYRLIASNVSNCPGSGRVPQGFHESEYLAEKLNKVQNLIASGESLKDSQETKEIIAEFEAMIDAVETFRAKCSNQGLVQNLDPWLKSLNDLAHAGAKGLKSLIALENKDYSAAWENLSSATQYYSTMYTYLTAPDLPDNPAKAGSRRLEPVVSAALSRAKAELNPIMNPNDDSITPSLFAKMGGANQPDDANGKKMYDGDESTVAGWQIVQKEGDYYGLDLGKVVTVRDISILQGQTDTHHDIFHDAVLQVSEDKEKWTDIEAKTEGARITADGLNVKARYVRYYLKTTGFGSKPDFWTFVREFTVNKPVPEYDRVYTNAESLKTTPLTIQGAELSIRNLKAVTLEAGQYIGIKLVNPGVVTSFVKEISNAAGLTWEYSYNEAEWTAVPEEMSANAAVKYVRLINKTNAAVTTDISKIGMTVETTKAQPKVIAHNLNNALKAGSFENMFDGDLATYAWTNEPQQTGDYFLIDLGGNIRLHDLRIVTADGNPRFYNADIQISSDKKEWTTLTSVPGNAGYDVVNPPYRFLEMDAKGQSARYLKIAITGDIGWYLQIYEIEINRKAEADAAADAVLTNMSGQKDNIADNNITTLFAADAKAGSYVEYRISKNTNIDQITIVQGQAGTGKAIAKTPQGNVELGVLDESVNIFDTSSLEAVTAVRIEWAQEEKAAIYEIFVSEGKNVSDDIGEYTEPIIEEGTEEPGKPEPTNIALGKPVVSNGCEIEGAANEGNVNDGDISTKWDGVHLKGNDAQENSWIYIDLGEEKQYEISRIVAKYFNKVYPTDYDVQVSDDAENWTTIETKTKEDNGTPHPEDVFLEEALTARYVRLFFRSVNAAAGGNGVAVTEFEIYGVEAQTPPVEEGCKHENAVHTAAKAADCVTAGNPEYWYCGECKLYFEDAECTKEIGEKAPVIAALGHSAEEKWTSDAKEHWHKCSRCDVKLETAEHTWDAGEVTKEATCTEKGKKTLKCTVCGATKSEEIAALGHSAEEKWTSDAKEHWHKCSRCDAKLETAEHTWDAGEVTKEATCTEKGTKTLKCTVCGATKSEEIAALGHSAEEKWTSDTKEHWHKCSRCDAKLETAEHTWDAGKVTEEATSEKPGVKTYTCEICGATKTEVIDQIKPEEPEKPTEPEKPLPPQKAPFTDISRDVYNYDAIVWAYNEKIAKGVDETHFVPENVATRAEMITFLWRANGEKKAEGTKNPFKDIKADDYYYDAVLWAVENKITEGTDAEHFSPNQPVTRGQCVTFLHRLHNQPKASKTTFKDVDKNAYYYEAVLWASEQGIVKGYNEVQFAPEDACTRGQVMTILYRAK